jgi:hypothetical protein
MRLAKWLGCAAWAGSWYLMYLEVTRWRHVKPSLAFNSDPIPGIGVRPRPGLPLIVVYITCAAAPLTVMAVLVRERRTGRLPAPRGSADAATVSRIRSGKSKASARTGAWFPCYLSGAPRA